MAKKSASLESDLMKVPEAQVQMRVFPLFDSNYGLNPAAFDTIATKLGDLCDTAPHPMKWEKIIGVGKRRRWERIVFKGWIVAELDDTKDTTEKRALALSKSAINIVRTMRSSCKDNNYTLVCTTATTRLPHKLELLAIPDKFLAIEALWPFTNWTIAQGVEFIHRLQLIEKSHPFDLLRVSGEDAVVGVDFRMPIKNSDVLKKQIESLFAEFEYMKITKEFRKTGYFEFNWGYSPLDSGELRQIAKGKL